MIGGLLLPAGRGETKAEAAADLVTGAQRRSVIQISTDPDGLAAQQNAAVHSRTVVCFIAVIHCPDAYGFRFSVQLRRISKVAAQIQPAPHKPQEKPKHHQRWTAHCFPAKERGGADRRQNQGCQYGDIQPGKQSIAAQGAGCAKADDHPHKFPHSARSPF